MAIGQVHRWDGVEQGPQVAGFTRTNQPHRVADAIGRAEVHVRAMIRSPSVHPCRRVRAFRIVVRIHAQHGLGMTADGVEVLGKQLFPLFECLLVKFQAALPNTLNAQNSHDAGACVVFSGLAVNRKRRFFIHGEPPLLEKGFEPFTDQAIKGLRSAFERRFSRSGGVDDVQVRIRIAVEFVLQFSLPIAHIRAGGHQMGFVRRGDNDAERVEPGQAGCFALMSCTIWAISKPMRSCAAPVAAPTWGVRETRGWRMTSNRGLGSPTNTSTPAPPN